MNSNQVFLPMFYLFRVSINFYFSLSLSNFLSILFFSSDSLSLSLFPFLPPSLSYSLSAYLFPWPYEYLSYLSITLPFLPSLQTPFEHCPCFCAKSKATDQSSISNEASKLSEPKQQGLTIRTFESEVETGLTSSVSGQGQLIQSPGWWISSLKVRGSISWYSKELEDTFWHEAVTSWTVQDTRQDVARAENRCTWTRGKGRGGGGEEGRSWYIVGD